MHINYFQNAYVCKGGKISLYGSIRILTKRAEESPREDCGLEMWSERLVEYGKQDATAVISAEGVKVADSGGKVVATIPFREFHPVRRWKVIVLEDGHLHTIGSAGGYFYTSDEEKLFDVEDRRATLKALRKAEKGEHPEMVDNSPFLKVSRELAGQELIELELDYMDGTYVVYTQNGERVPHGVHYPLSYKKWEPNSPYVQFSR